MSSALLNLTIADLREARDPHDAAPAIMQADLGRIYADGGNPLVCHQPLRVADDCWYWYQRYHHLLVDGFSFRYYPPDRGNLSRLARGGDAGVAISALR